MGNLFVCMASGSGDDRKDFDHMCHECGSQFGDNKGLEDHMKSLHKANTNALNVNVSLQRRRKESSTCRIYGKCSKKY